MNLVRRTAFLLALIMILALGHAFADAIPVASRSNNDSGTVRVRLDSIGKPGVYNVTVTGNYTAGSLNISSGGKVTVTASDGAFTLSYGGSSYNMGSSFYLSRKGDGSAKIAQALQPSNPYPADLRFIYISGNPYIVAHVYIEDYLPGVVGYEMSDSFPLESLKAQAIAARTYAMRAATANSGRAYDVVDTTSDQVYRGTPSGNSNVKSAVSSTKGMTLMYNNAYCQVYYSSSNGGQTESNAHAWGGSALPYYQITDDPFDLKNPNSTAKKGTVYASFASNSAAVRNLISSAAGTSDIATITSVQLTTSKYSAPSKLYTQAIISYVTSGGTSRACTVNLFGGLTSALGIAIGGLKNELHSVEAVSGGFRITARRYGHGVGLSQYGAQQMAKEGYDYLSILGFYFNGASLVKNSFIGTVASGGGDSAGETAVNLPQTAVSTGTTAYVSLSDKDGRLNMRRKASGSSTIVKKIPNGSKIEIISTDAKGWIKTKYDGVTGYVVAQYVSVNAPASAADTGSKTDTAQKLGVGKVSISSGNLNLRASASSDAKVLARIPNGTSVDVYARNGAWMEVYYKGIYGYASADLISLDGSSTASSTVSAAPVQEGTGVVQT
ncbi:MAG: SpoIID/LytB domain-containing protein, partial [Oscillospiraceae bacterium]|nr:SpoIID/LytB domain-containing protein [Oscillospiraceae bacterium]